MSTSRIENETNPVNGDAALSGVDPEKRNK